MEGTMYRHHHRCARDQRRPLVNLLSVAALVAAALASSLAVAPAQAQSIGAEIDLGIPVGDTADALDIGWGARGRVGYGLPIPALTFDVEAAFDYYSFPLADIDATSSLWRIVGGVRLGVPVPYVPELFAHVGYGEHSFPNDLGVDLNQDGFTWDLGLSSDLLSLPLIAFGLHLAYVKLVPDESTTFLALGIHAELGF
jgi:hypothetical protein